MIPCLLITRPEHQLANIATLVSNLSPLIAPFVAVITTSDDRSGMTDIFYHSIKHNSTWPQLFPLATLSGNSMPNHRYCLYGIGSSPRGGRQLSISTIIRTNHPGGHYANFYPHSLFYIEHMQLMGGYGVPGGWNNIKMSSSQYRKYHYGDKTILRPSYLHNGIPYTGKMISLYSIGALEMATKRCALWCWNAWMWKVRMGYSLT